MDLLYILMAFGFGVIFGAIGAAQIVRRDVARWEQEDPDWFWRGGTDAEWRPYSE